MSKNQESNKDWQKFNTMQSDPECVEMMDELNEAMAAQDTPALDHPSYQELEDKLTLAEQKERETWGKLERALAEGENFRRRAERDVENAHKYGLEKISQALLPVGDSFEQALSMMTPDVPPSVIEGLNLTMKLFLDVLNKFEIKQVNPLGELFDPQQHEAMSIQESNDVAPHTVLAVFQKGYTLHGRVIRPARVVVAKSQEK